MREKNKQTEWDPKHDTVYVGNIYPKQYYPFRAMQTKEHAFKISEWLLIYVKESEDKEG